MKKFLAINEHGVDRVLRVILGIGLVALAFIGPKTPLGFLGIIPLATGLVAAAALVRPSRSILDLPVKSVRKKWKDKAFAAGVNREVIEKGAAMLGISIEELIADTIEGMKPVAGQIGLKGNL